MITLSNKIMRCFSTAPQLLLFAGQGTQQLNMLNSLQQIPQAKIQIQNYSNKLGIDFIKITTNPENQQQINNTQITQPLLVMTQCLMLKYFCNKNKQGFNRYGINSDHILIGHSIGEYSALVAANSIQLESCLKLVQRRGQLMVKYTTEASGMLFIRYNDVKKDTLVKILAQFNSEIACYNTQYNIIVAGVISKLQKLRDQLKNVKITSIFLPVSSAFHCKMLQPMKQPYKSELQKLEIKTPQCKILRNYDTQVYQKREDIIEGLVNHLTNPVKFYQSIAILHSDSFLNQLNLSQPIEFEQIGHKQHLAKFVKEIRKSFDKNDSIEMLRNFKIAF